MTKFRPCPRQITQIFCWWKIDFIQHQDHHCNTQQYFGLYLLQSFIPVRGKYWTNAVAMARPTVKFSFFEHQPVLFTLNNVKTFKLGNVASLVSLLVLANGLFVPHQELQGFGFCHRICCTRLDRRKKRVSVSSVLWLWSLVSRKTCHGKWKFDWK